MENVVVSASFPAGQSDLRHYVDQGVVVWGDGPRGARVSKIFHGRPYVGHVVGYTASSNLFQVHYPEDDDREEMNIQELFNHLVYWPGPEYCRDTSTKDRALNPHYPHLIDNWDNNSRFGMRRELPEGGEVAALLFKYIAFLKKGGTPPETLVGAELYIKGAARVQHPP